MLSERRLMPRKNAALFSIDDIVEQANLIYVRKKI
jgi:hypothetical protein